MCGGLARQCHIRSEHAVGSGVDGNALNVLLRHGFQIDGPINAAIVPIITAPLGVVNRRVGGLVVHGDFQQIFAGTQQRGDVVFEAVVAALVHGAGGLAVDAYLGVGHYALKHNEDMFVGPADWGCEDALVASLHLRPGFEFVATVGVNAKALQLPV